MKYLLICTISFLLAGCSVFSSGKYETASYQVIKADIEQNVEVRRYDNLVLASTPMTVKKDTADRNSAFMNLFDYISGENAGQNKIEMTTPVIMDDKKPSGTNIPMTTPVLMDEQTDAPTMSFVLPHSYTLDTAPKPTNPEVQLKQLKDYTVAAIRFNGRLTDSNIQKHKDMLEKWITNNGYVVTGDYKTAAYNAPFTLPMFRRNEVLIPIK